MCNNVQCVISDHAATAHKGKKANDYSAAEDPILTATFTRIPMRESVRTLPAHVRDFINLAPRGAHVTEPKYLCF